MDQQALPQGGTVFAEKAQLQQHFAALQPSPPAAGSPSPAPPATTTSPPPAHVFEMDASPAPAAELDGATASPPPYSSPGPLSNASLASHVSPPLHYPQQSQALQPHEEKQVLSQLYLQQEEEERQILQALQKQHDIPPLQHQLRNQPQPVMSFKKAPQSYAGLPALDYKLYQPPLFELAPDCTFIKSSAPYLSSTTTALVSLMRAQATVPPKQQVHITGKRGRGQPDFAIKLNLMSLFVPEDPADRMDYLRCVAGHEVVFRGGVKPTAEPSVGPEFGLEGWARRFVDDTDGPKSFTLERVVANLDTEYIEGQIRGLISGTGYKGNVTVTFPVTHSKVIVKSPPKNGKIMSSMSTMFSGKKKRYEVVKVVWPFASARSGEPGRRCAVQTEEAWWAEWRDPIRFAVATKRHGWVTNEDKLEAIMEGAGKGVNAVDWGPEASPEVGTQ